MNMADWVRERRQMNDLVADAEAKATENDRKKAERNWQRFVSELESVMDERNPGQGRLVRDSFYCYDPKTMRTGSDGWGHRGLDEHLIIGDAHYHRDPKGIEIRNTFSSSRVSVDRALHLLAMQLADGRRWADTDFKERIY